MKITLSGLLMVAALSWNSTQDPGQRPPRPGADGGLGAGREERDPGRPPRPDDFGPDDFPPPPPPPPNLMFLALDLDKDGEISAKELAKASTSLAKLDKNKDGIITEDEVRPPRPGGRRGPGGPPGGPDGPPGGGPPGGARVADPKALVDSVMKLDKNNDGKISAQELPERMARLMTEGDSNKDGFLERSEIEALSKRQGTQTNRRPGPPGGGPDNR